MIIKDKPLPIFFYRCVLLLIGWSLNKRFKNITINKIEIKPGHSYLLMCNHFSFLDGFIAYYLSQRAILNKSDLNGLRIIVMKAQLEKNNWTRYFGCFSIDPGKRTMAESFRHAINILSNPGKLLLFFPQGNLESCHVRTIKFQSGLKEIVPRIEGKCQLIWCSNIIEYLEGLKPSLTCSMLDCGTNEDFDFEQLKEKVNAFHQAALDKNVRFTPSGS